MAELLFVKFRRDMFFFKLQLQHFTKWYDKKPSIYFNILEYLSTLDLLSFDKSYL